jgi:Xaa-Pro aminopeptidase
MIIKDKEYKRRRQRVLKKMDTGVMILSGASYKVRSHDTEYPFRQKSNFYYLSGFLEDNAILMLIRSKKTTKTILFVQAKDKKMELWSGKRVGVKAARKRFSVDKVYDIATFESRAKRLLSGHHNLYVDLFNDDPFLQKIQNITKELKNDRSIKVAPRNFYDATPIIERMRLQKSAAEIKTIQAALLITKKAHERAMAEAKSAHFEYELQAHIEHVFKKEGAYSDAYTTIVASGNNANTLHYIKNVKRLSSGDLVLIDAGCEFEMYASDITRTFAVSGVFSPAQKELYEMVLAVQENIICAIKPGVKRSKLQRMCEAQLCDGLIALGILKGKRKTLLKRKAHKKYFPHGVGHWMGIDVHDEAPYTDDRGREIPLKKGMVLTIEPGVYIDKKDKKVPKKYRGMGIRIEDNILVTQDGYTNLSSDIAKSVEAIEAIMAKF